MGKTMDDMKGDISRNIQDCKAILFAGLEWGLDAGILLGMGLFGVLLYFICFQFLFIYF